MLVVLSGGGTAGHINPALALAEVLIDRGHTVRFAGTPQGVEARLVAQAGIEFTPFEAAGFNRRHPLSLFGAVKKIAKSSVAAQKWFEEIKPDVVVGFGGYVCIPVGRAARALRIPLVVHEQNSVMGMANTYLAKHAAAVALTYGVAARALNDTDKVVVTGNPVRRQVFAATREEGRALLSLPEDALMLLVFGGSLGARHLNTALVALKEQLLAVEDLFIVHITGPKEYDTVCRQLNLDDAEKKRWQVMGYQDRMGETMAAADIVVSRAGATSLAEISARRIPAVLVPFPFATDDHQTTNAREYAQRGAAVMVADDQVETPLFQQVLFDVIDNPSVRRAMCEAANTFGTQDAAAKLADVVCSAAGSPANTLQ
ncbi:MAG: undecaprenyldiphospho-muramoylpentapeptide beta-N-acetylglucosaminyltransferase [Raoultibacter sp.]